jgi:Tfp pilus assembly protein PilN
MNPPGWIRKLSRADFLRSVGLYIMRDRLVLVRLRKNFLNLALVEHEARQLPQGEERQAISELTGWIAEDVREIALKAEQDSRERTLRQAVLSLLPHFNAGRDALHICVPQERAIVQQLYFPLAAEGNLRQVLEYEIERYLPFRREDLFYDFLPIGRRGDKIGVCLFAVPKKSVIGVLSVLESFGIVPKGVETTATAVANYLLFCERDLSGPATIVGGDEESWEMVGVQDKRTGWLSPPELLFSHRLPEAEWAEGARKELLSESLKQSPKIYGWGSAAKDLGSATNDSLIYHDLLALGKEKLHLGAEVISNPNVLPALGAALRGVREAALVLNVLQGPGAELREGRRLSLLNAVLVGLLAIALVGWGVSYPIKDELRLRQLQRENHTLEPAVEALQQEEKQLQGVRGEVRMLSQIDERKGEALRILDELSKVIPTSAYLSNFRYRNGIVEIQGNAENASALIPLLERSPLFENVGFNAPSNRGRDNRETFSLKADLEEPRPKEKPIKR